MWPFGKGKSKNKDKDTKNNDKDKDKDKSKRMGGGCHSVATEPEDLLSMEVDNFDHGGSSNIGNMDLHDVDMNTAEPLGYLKRFYSLFFV
jgi:hypothetical protein